MKSIFEVAPNSLRVFQLEVTNWCNATCTYCPQPTHVRPKGFLAEDVLHATLRAMSNRSFQLHHFGEPLLHKGLEKLITICAVEGFDVGISTNGKTLTQSRLDGLAASGLKWLRLHTDPFGVRLRSFAVPEGLEMTEHRLLVKSDAPKKEMQDFAGYLDLAGDRPRIGSARCSFLRDDWRVVLWNGDLALCCNDVEGTRALQLCTSCDGYVFESPRAIGNYGGDQ